MSRQEIRQTIVSCDRCGKTDLGPQSPFMQGDAHMRVSVTENSPNGDSGGASYECDFCLPCHKAFRKWLADFRMCMHGFESRRKEMRNWEKLKAAVASACLAPSSIDESAEFMEFEGLWMLGPYPQGHPSKGFFICEGRDECWGWGDDEEFGTIDAVMDSLVARVWKLQRKLSRILAEFPDEARPETAN